MIPGADRAQLDLRKLADYCLDPAHPRGRHKARVFRDALGVEQSDAAWLKDVLLEAVDSQQAAQAGADPFGTRWRLDVRVSRQTKTAVIRTVWMVRTGETVARFITCWVL
jgi:hypothetical protein